IPQHRHGEPAAVVGIGGMIRFAQMLEAVDWVAGKPVAVAKSPAAVVAPRIDDSHADDVLQSLEGAGDDDAMRPGTGVADVEMVTVGGGRKLSRTVGLHPVAKGVFLALEAAILILLGRKLGGGSHGSTRRVGISRVASAWHGLGILRGRHAFRRSATGRRFQNT